MRAGWARGDAPALHDDTTPKLFGQDKFSNKKHYLQCLLAQEELRQKGLLALPSGQSSWYYRAVLASERPSGVSPGATVKVYKALLFGDGQDKEAVADTGPAARLAICDASSCDDASDSSDVLAFPILGVLADEEPEANEASAQFPPVWLDEVQSLEPTGQALPLGADASPRRDSSSSSESEASLEDSGQELVSFVPGGPMAARGNARPPLNECIRVEEHLRPGMPGYYRRYTTVCPLARTGHCAVIACGKRRNCGAAQVGSLGPAAPEAFLMVWRQQASAFATKHDHQRWSPTVAEVRRYMVDHGWLVQ